MEFVESMDSLQMEPSSVGCLGTEGGSTYKDSVLRILYTMIKHISLLAQRLRLYMYERDPGGRGL